MSKEQSNALTAEEYLRNINWWSDESDGKFWADQWQLAEAMDLYANAKLLEVLEKECVGALVSSYFNDDIMKIEGGEYKAGDYYKAVKTKAKEYFETQVKPKYQNKDE
jgi:hypothetical protein